MPDLYIIAGCNGAGKTTASYIVLPEILNCREFVNADNIAAGLSPFYPESVAVEAGRMMLQRIHHLIDEQVDFAFETTLSTRSYASLIKKVKEDGYKVTLLFFWLSSPDFAKKRVADRVAEGGHNIPPEVIKRRYYRGLPNLIKIYIPLCDAWTVVDNMNGIPEVIASGAMNDEKLILNPDIWGVISEQSNYNG
ncbi:MAG TPA: zeta toxin family protein [Chitinophaga sp.]|uniref:zeta toxin family protein n=1 Tax=Chitinophaga sp. TaxID=1869181 RepID=UPI002B9F797A|nr:zeta toxin family protein [Chitinophaga sp.]HVI47165.1 zeta toxin family protein [Chitinophaga sp.]